MGIGDGRLRITLRLEGLVVFLLAVGYYFLNDYSLILFLVLLLVPDIGMIGYAINTKTGAAVYNLFHTYSTPLLFIFLSMFTKQDTLLMVGLIWTAHIGMDRALGYGLKYSTGFKDTHLGKL